MERASPLTVTELTRHIKTSNAYSHLPVIALTTLAGDDTPGKVRFPGLPLGAANEVILNDLLEYTPDQIRQMIENKVI